MERSPSPEPFREPDGMVTIDLNKRSPILCTKKIRATNPKRRPYVVTGLIVILIFCLLSLLTAVFIHLEDIEWFFSKLRNKHKNVTPDSPEHLKAADWVDESSIEHQTCGLNFRYQYETQLSVCEKTQTFTDCCHTYLRSNSEEINDACSIIEILNYLSEYQKLCQRRLKRNSENQRTASYSITEIENQQKSKIQTKKKIQSYLQTVNEPLRKELPDLWNWIENSVLKESSQLREDNLDKNGAQIQPHIESNVIKTDYHKLDNDQETSRHNHESKVNLGISPHSNESSEIIESENEVKQYIFEKNVSDHLPQKIGLLIRNVEIKNPEKSSIPPETAEVEQKLPDSTLLLNPHDSIDFHKEINKKVISLPKYIESQKEEPKTPAEINIDFFPNINPSNEKNQHAFLIFTNENTLEPLRSFSQLDRISIKHRKKRFFQFPKNPIYETQSEYDYPMEEQSLPMPKYSRMENNYGYHNPEFHEYKNSFSQNEEDTESFNGHSYETIPQDSKLGTAILDPSSKGGEHYRNEMYIPSWNERENIRSHSEPKTMEVDTWKKLNNSQLPETSLEKQDKPQNPLFTQNSPKMESMKAVNSEITDHPTTTSINQILFDKSSGIMSNGETMDEGSTHDSSKQHELVYEKPKGNEPLFAGVSVVSATEQKDAIKEFRTTTNAGPLDATDSIQNINQIQTNNQSLRVDFENTTIVIAERKNKTINSTTETSLGFDKNEEVSHTSDFRRVSSNLDFRGTPQQGDFEPKTKGRIFPNGNDDVQGIQNNLINTCIHPPTYTLGSPYKYAVAYDNPQFLNIIPSNNIQKQNPIYVINPSVFSYIPPSPIVSHYGSTNQNYNPYRIINPVSPLPNTNNIAHGPVQVAGAGGQYYVCNPVPLPANGNAVANIPGVEIRREMHNIKVSNLQRTSNVYSRNMFRNRTRAALECPMEEQSCLDGSKCISERHICDNEVHCEDGSDEMFCSCRDRIGEIRLCDGYYDCPDGEDEKGCFGCAEDEISCDDWSRFRKGTCVPMEQRCDGVRNCDVTGKDEDDCSILTDHMGETNPIKVSNAVGFLHRNFKGKWYPTCFGSELWAIDVCKTEAGPSNSAPKSHLVPISENYDGEFINILSNREMGLVNSCVQGRGSFVECPPLFCGLRMTVKNPYRPQEVDTSIEELMNNLNRDNILDENLDPMRDFERASNGTSHHIRDFVLGNERVVGGKASQPAAWPWVVSIYKNGIFHCGGVIINELWVVTAAHCVDKYWLFYYEVQAGILRRFSYSPMEQSRWVVAAIAHEEYNKSNLKNDIALLKLSSPVRYNRYVRPICLPSEATAGQDFLRGPSPGTICTTVGWGAIMEHGTDPDHMREVQVPILKRCKHPEDEEGNEICAGLFEGGKDACQGDSGGPFMCQNPNNPSQWYLSGIVSHGEGCARPNEPGVYTRVSEYIAWIADNIREDNFFPRTPLAKCPGYVCKDINKCIPRKRRCDKFVDCLLGDDESNCENNFHNIFKHSRIFQPFFRESPKEIEKSRKHSEKSVGDSIVGATIINAEDESEVTKEPLETITKTDIEKRPNKGKIIYKYDKREYFNNNTDDPHIFRCNKMLQIIPLEKRCNKVFDCEDATDEKNCQCVDYLKLEHPASICDGTVDCIDQSDENICYSCKKDEFNCKMSEMCISLSLRCNGIPDCTKSEDELDCVALTNGKTLILDSDFRPNLHMSGIVSVNRLGIWRPYCLPVNNKTKPEAEIAAGVCNYLGYEDYTGFRKLYIYNESLAIKSKTDLKIPSESKLNSSKCLGIYVWCTNTTTNKNFAIETNLHQPYNAPWNAVIFAGGVYKCMGALLNNQWIITSVKCFDDIMMYKLTSLSVSLGKGLKYLNVVSPHETIVRVIKAVEVNGSDIALLKLEHSVEMNRYIQPTHLSSSSSIANQWHEDCMALGIADDQIEIVLLRSNNTCSRGNKCFNAVHERNCSTNSWSGVITCNYGNGWYPASVFEIRDGVCGFLRPTKFTNIQYWTQIIGEQIMDNDSTVPSVACDGYLCKLGNCIKIQEVCDGIPHCRMSEDEDFSMCRNRENFCHLTHTCVCPRDHITCANGLCVPKKKFCDRNNDCGDFSDEPSICTCRSYLILAHPENVCDGLVHCFDRSDEDPKLCPCHTQNFKCERNGQCIGNEMVCDGHKDCPDGEDERNCFSLISKMFSSSSGEVMTKIAGQMSVGCFPDTPSHSDLDKICEDSGYARCVDHHLTEFDADSNNTLVPILNNFHVVWIRRDREIPLMYRMRTGNDAHLSFRKQTNCHRLYVQCI